MLTVDFDRLGLRPGELLLDVGAGSGRHAREALRRGASTIAVDLDPASLAGAATSLREIGSEGHVCVRGDALRLPLAGGSCDRVVISEVLEHVPHDEAAIAEAWRVLRDGGSLAVTVPRRFPERVCWALSRRYHDRPGGHVRIYRGHELLAKVEAAGFQAAGAHHAHALHTPYWWLRCLVGVDRDEQRLVRFYHSVLVWDMFSRPRAMRLLERALNPVLGKSLVLYFVKPPAGQRATKLAA